MKVACLELRPGLGSGASDHDEEEADPVTAIRLDHVVIAVSDWERSVDFYRGVVGVEVIDCGAGRVCFRSGRRNSASTVQAYTRRPMWPACRCARETVISAFAGTA